MTIKRLLGTAPEQVSRNRDLGNLAFQNKEGPHFDNLIIDGTVGIGTTTPSKNVEIYGAGSPTLAITSSSTTGTRQAAIRLNVSSTGGNDPAGGIDFTYGPSFTSAAQIYAICNPSTLFFSTGGSTRATINENGVLALNQGQISFPATQNASSNANTLDDYEEGTWTPVIKGSTGDPTITYSKQYGTYTKIGNVVNLRFDVRWTAKSGGTGTLYIGGIPFSSGSEYSPGILVEVAGITLGASYVFMGLEVYSLGIYPIQSASGLSSSGIAPSNLGNAGLFIGGAVVFTS